MNQMIKPISLGIAAYVLSTVGLWFVSSYLLYPIMPGAIWVSQGVVTLIPLFLSGYVGAKFAVARHRSHKVTMGIVAALIGYGVSLMIGRAQGDEWLFVLLILGAAIVAAVGGLLGAKRED